MNSQKTIRRAVASGKLKSTKIQNKTRIEKLDFDFVLEELKKGRGTQFDPKLVDILLSLIEDGTIDVEQIYGASGNKER